MPDLLDSKLIIPMSNDDGNIGHRRCYKRVLQRGQPEKNTSRTNKQTPDKYWHPKHYFNIVYSSCWYVKGRQKYQ